MNIKTLGKVCGRDLGSGTRWARGFYIPPPPPYRKSEIRVLWLCSNRPPELVPCTMPFLGYLGCITGLLRSFPAQHRAGGNTPTWPGCEEVFRVWEKTGRGLLGITIKPRSICLWLQGFWVGLCLSHLMSFDHGMNREKPPNLTGDVELFFSFRRCFSFSPSSAHLCLLWLSIDSFLSDESRFLST